MNDELTLVRVWDLPTRLFHWTLATGVAASVVTAHVGGNALAWHFRLGYVVFALLVFRLLWGVVGGHWSRFVNFLYAPSTVLRYLRGEPRAGEHVEVGHNPLGALSVFALLALLAAQVGTGLFTDDEIASTGPLNRLVASATGLALTRWHKSFGQWLIVALVVLHLVAITYHVVKKKHDLVRPMIGGDKPLAPGVPASADNGRTRLLALVLVALSAGLVAWVVSLGN